MLAKDVMTTEVITVTPEEEVTRIAQLLLAHRVSAVPVVDENQNVIGMVSEADLIRRAGLQNPGHWWLSLFASRASEFVRVSGTRARDVMTRPVITIQGDVPIAIVAHILEVNRVKRVPVLDDSGRLVGIISRANILRGLAAMAPRSGRPYPHGDRDMQAAVLELLKGQAWVPLHAVNIIVHDGVIHLWGVADSEDDRNAIRVAAENVAGASKVQDFLTTVPEILKNVASGRSTN